MTIKEYKARSKELNDSIEKLSKEKTDKETELKDLNKQFKCEFYTCSDSSSYFLNSNGEINYSSNKSCNKVIKRSKLLTVKIRSMEVECVHEDWFNSGGNEYQLVYTETTYKMCPNCFKVLEVSKDVIYRFPSVYDRGDANMYIEQQRLKLIEKYKTEIKIFDNKGKEVSLEYIFRNK